jgi:hypothetical protein
MVLEDEIIAETLPVDRVLIYEIIAGIFPADMILRFKISLYGTKQRKKRKA